METQVTGIVSQTNFTSLDWGIVIIYLLVSVAIGLFVKKFVRNMADYITAGRALRAAYLPGNSNSDRDRDGLDYRNV